MNKKRIIEKLKSPVVWTAVAIQVANIIMVFNPDISDTFKAIATPIITIATLFGILNDPNSKDTF